MIVTILTWQGRMQTTCWKDSDSLVVRALAADPNNELANYDVARSLLSEGRLDQAASHFQRILNVIPSNADLHSHINPAIVHTFLGNIFAQENLLDRALAEYRKAVDSDPGFADAHSNLGALLARQGNFSDAISEFEAALKIPPEDAGSHLRLATLLKKVGKYDLADFHYRRASELADQSTEVQNAVSQKPLATLKPDN